MPRELQVSRMPRTTASIAHLFLELDPADQVKIVLAIADSDWWQKRGFELFVDALINADGAHMLISIVVELLARSPRLQTLIEEVRETDSKLH